MNRRLAAIVAGTLTLSFGAIAQADSQKNVVSLIHLAKKAGFTYTYLGADDSVLLEKGALTIDIRPGFPLMDVNDHTVPIDGPAPQSYRGDILVSNQFIKRLKWYAHQPAAFAMMNRGKSQNTSMINMTPPVAASAEPAGPVTDFVVAQAKGFPALDVHGHTSPNTVVYVTVRAVFADAVPEVLVSRVSFESDANGSFDGRAKTVNSFFTGALFKVSATTDRTDDVGQAHAQIVLDEDRFNTEIVAPDHPKDK